MFFDTYQPFFAKWFTYFSKTIYLLPEKGLPFQLKKSTFFAEKVDPFSKVALRTKFFPMFVIYDVKENVLGLR